MGGDTMETKLIKRIMKIIKTLQTRWKAETPLMAKKIRNIAGVITAAMPTAWGIVGSMPKMMDVFPNGFTKWVGYITLIAAIITTIAGLQTKKD